MNVQGFDDGVGTLIQSSLCQFPLTFDEPMNLLIALAKAGRDSALQVHLQLMLGCSHTVHIDNGLHKLIPSFMPLHESCGPVITSILTLAYVN